jgi:hypothetical protein
MRQFAPGWATLGCVLAATALVPAAPPQGKGPQALSVARFEQLHQQLQPSKDEVWQQLPWKLSLLEARDQAAKEKKPIFMLVRSGHPLGCV